MEKTWLENNEMLGPEVLALIVAEAQRTKFTGEMPGPFAVLKGTHVDLGFEDLGLPEDRLFAIRMAFCHTGVRVPGTNYRLRNPRGMISVVEPADGTESEELPDHWRESVVRYNGDDVTFIGRRVRRERVDHLDFSNYRLIGVGWSPKPELIPLTPAQRDFLDRYYIENLEFEEYKGQGYAFTLSRKHGFSKEHMDRLWESYWHGEGAPDHSEFPGIPPLSPPPDLPVFPWSSIQELEDQLAAVGRPMGVPPDEWKR